MFLRNLYRLHAPAEEGTDGGGATDPAPVEEPTEGTPAKAAPESGTEDTKTGTEDTKTGTAPEARWPDDWRNQLAGESEADLKRLGRFGSMSDVWRSYRSLEAKMSSGELKSQLPKEATDEQLAAWRQENGIPDKPGGYAEMMGDLVIGEGEQDRANHFFELAHKHNLPPEAAKDMVAWSYAQQEAEQAQRAEQDEVVRTEGMQELMQEWGGNYQGNLNAVAGLLDMFTVDAKDAIMNARDGDGDPLLSNPGVLKGLLLQAREINPASTLLPAGGRGGMQSITEEIQKIESQMGTDAYIRDESLQARYRELVNARESMEKRSAA